MGSGLKRSHLQALAEAKLQDAKILFVNKRYSNAYYLSGYAVELGLKACIAKNISPETIPDKDTIKKIFDHNWKSLIGLAGLLPELEDQQGKDPDFGANWALASEWSPDVRYRDVDPISAQLIIEAIGDPKSGIDMDQNILVSGGQALVAALDKAGLSPRAAMWVHNTDSDTWRLWLVPPSDVKDRRAFYRKVSEVVSEHRPDLHGIEASDTEMIADSHPAAKALRQVVRMAGLGSARFSGNTFNGYYLPDGIILRSAL